MWARGGRWPQGRRAPFHSAAPCAAPRAPLPAGPAPVGAVVHVAGEAVPLQPAVDLGVACAAGRGHGGGSVGPRRWRAWHACRRKHPCTLKPPCWHQAHPPRCRARAKCRCSGLGTVTAGQGVVCAGSVGVGECSVRAAALPAAHSNPGRGRHPQGRSRTVHAAPLLLRREERGQQEVGPAGGALVVNYAGLKISL